MVKADIIMATQGVGVTSWQRGLNFVVFPPPSEMREGMMGTGMWFWIMMSFLYVCVIARNDFRIALEVMQDYNFSSD